MDAATERSKPKTIVMTISLATATDRRERFAARAAETSLPWSFFDAYTAIHPKLRYDEDRAIITRGRPLGRGEIGCYSSHYAAWHALLESDADQMLLFEDDVIVDWRYIEGLANIDLAARGLHYLRLFSKRIYGIEDMVQGLVSDQYHVLTLKSLVYGTQGYAMTRSAAERLIQHCGDLVRPIDDELDRSWAHGIPNRLVFPSPLIEEFAPSTIEGARYQEYEIPARLKQQRKIAVYREKALRLSRHLTGRGKKDRVGPIIR